MFLDRDGILNRNRDDYVKDISELEIFPNIENFIKKLQASGFLIIVVSNQSAINRGLTTHSNVDEIHASIQAYLNKFGANIDNFYYCPHTPAENCTCRKPKPGLLIKAIDDFSIDPLSSWMVGDRDSDVDAGESVGCKTIKIQENSCDFENILKTILS
ncbi:HAD family hydrolase [Nitrosopumilus sp. SJ]|uniref:D-glycero-alpha-D-manno-heptose-1,7-bisphosphate 7-phosphatase n=1 Tax=Nitrosopumilus sp. SJ TaxID=1027374 RepID=UPI000477B19A|nr:HAD family hydrolase [Nitrosopumilus sp. SJ]